MKICRICLMALLLAVAVRAQTAGISWQCLSAGGGPGSSASFLLNGTLGQSIQGTGAATNVLGVWGFWASGEAMPPAMAGWQEVKQMPGDKPPKDGAWLVVAPENLQPAHSAAPVIYAAKGNKTYEFYKYLPGDNQWVALPSIPDTEPTLGKPKPLSKGSCAVSDGKEYLYVLRGNNTQGFWRYRIEDGAWDTLARVPVKIKGGNDLVYVENGAGDEIYLLAGGKTAFYRFSLSSQQWTALESAPFGNNKRKYAKGSFLVYDQNKYIYAHQANVVGENAHHFMYRYDLQKDSWDQTPLKGLPLYGTEGGAQNKKKKSKDGAAGIWYDGCLYAVKGGGSQGFYRYDPATASWAALETVPRNGTGGKKAIKAGADLVNWNNQALFLLKGNKTNEFWRYGLQTQQRTQPEPQAQTQTAVRTPLLRIVPNPIADGVATLSVNGAAYTWSAGQIRIFDAAGRALLSLTVSRSPGHTAFSSFPLDLRALPAGIYLVRLELGEVNLSQKLVLQK